MPTGIVAVIGVTVSEVGVKLVTINCEVLLTLPRVAVIVTGVGGLGTDGKAFTRPVCTPTVATVGLCVKVQVAWLVMFNVLPLANVPVAMNRRLVP
jgi:hypothetical protein